MSGYQQGNVWLREAFWHQGMVPLQGILCALHVQLLCRDMDIHQGMRLKLSLPEQLKNFLTRLWDGEGDQSMDSPPPELLQERLGAGWGHRLVDFSFSISGVPQLYESQASCS